MPHSHVLLQVETSRPSAARTPSHGSPPTYRSHAANGSRVESVLDAPTRLPRRTPDPIVAHNRSAVVSVIAVLDTRADDPLVQHAHLMRAYSELEALVRRNADRLTVRGLLSEVA